VGRALTVGVTLTTGLAILSGAGLAAGTGVPTSVAPLSTALVVDSSLVSSPDESVTIDTSSTEPTTTATSSTTTTTTTTTAPPSSAPPPPISPAVSTTVPPTSATPEATPPVITVPRPVPCVQCVCSLGASSVLNGFQGGPVTLVSAVASGTGAQREANQFTRIRFVVKVDANKTATLDKDKSKRLDLVVADKIKVETGTCLTVQFASRYRCSSLYLDLSKPDKYPREVKMTKADPESYVENGVTYYVRTISIWEWYADTTYTIELDCKTS
jgi:hypothetical protein